MENSPIEMKATEKARCYSHKTSNITISVVKTVDDLENQNGDLAFYIFLPSPYPVYDKSLSGKIDRELAHWLDTLQVESQDFRQLCKNISSCDIAHIPAKISFQQRLAYVKDIVLVYIVDDIFEALCLSDQTKKMALAHAHRVGAIMCGRDVPNLEFGQNDCPTAVAMVTTAYKVTRGVVSEARRFCEPEVVSNWFKANDIFQSNWNREMSCYASGLTAASLDLYDDIKTYGSGFLPVWALSLDRQDAMTVGSEDPFLRMCSAACLHMNDILSYFRERTELAEMPFNKIVIYMKHGKTETEAFKQCVQDFNFLMITLTTMYKYADQDKLKAYGIAMQFVIEAVNYHLNIERYGWYVANVKVTN
ncbi:hypothetical protein HDE_07936 [Halotydeus destructor]|nr:hypothetical protein HDE_07936 [Halotydeus destructor]